MGRGERPYAVRPTGAGSEDQSNSEASAQLTPQAWCRRILTSLSQRKMEGREAGYLEMLLTYFIELDPSTETFGDLLGRYVDDSRPGIAEAAGLLQRSWLRGRASTPAAPPPPLQEALRTLGGLLDESGARLVCLAVGPDGVRLQTFGDELSQRTLGPLELRQEMAARTALRGQVAATGAGGSSGYEALLRAVGAELDAEPAQSYELVVTPRAVIVEGSAGASRVFTAEELDALLRAAASQREASAAAPNEAGPEKLSSPLGDASDAAAS